jgi:hypothetical protein
MARFYPLPGVWRNVKLGTGNWATVVGTWPISTIHVATHRDRANAVGLQSVGGSPDGFATGWRPQQVRPALCPASGSEPSYRDAQE